MGNKSKQMMFLLTKILSLVVFPLVLYLCGLDLLMILSAEVLFVLCILCFKDINSNIFFFCFLLSFFVFLMSGDIASELFGKYYHIKFSEEVTRHSWITILISLIFLYLGYICKGNTQKKPLHIPKNNEEKIEKIRYSAKTVFYLTYCILLFNTIDKIQFVSRNGYVAYYSSYRSMLPSVIAEFGDFAPIALCVFFATFPSRKESMRPIALYFLYAILSLLVGARGGMIYNAVFLLGYMFYRNKRDKGIDVWISKKTVVLICLSIPFLLVFLFLYGYIRLGDDIEYVSFSQALVDFFVNIGSSSTIIKYGYEYRNEINEFKFYSLGDTLNYLKYGKLFNLFSQDAIPSIHSAEFALEGHSFDSFLSYKFMKTQFLSGEGAGSSYIAILFADFGYIGVAIGSFIYGMIFKSISSLNENSWLSTAIKLYFFLLLIKAPRGSYDAFFGGIININFWLVIFVIIFLSKYLKKGRAK